ncbi:hypothetical protein JTE90_022164 [Oedothorax gibbosus]|uniref:Sodium channel protein Nach n=1 Tax=Oedothorax gibbosus TaxID=931172 RepID=A0AAV6VUK5_9ARAC|nr:hypothetical protein JTE90_022164 [Oedothorax gibbosus]
MYLETKNKFNKKSGIFKKKIKDHSRRRKQRSAELSLLADFVANRLSAAGVSHVVKARSPIRRWFWLCTILITAALMFSMTYSVLKEYLEYPSIMRSKSVMVKELEFPAITVCGLNLIPRIFSKEAGLEYIEELEKVLSSLPEYNITIEEKTTCLKDPMCYWNYFDEKCYCHRNPCDTLYCYPDMDKSDEVCICSMLLCQWNGTREGCGILRDDSRGEWCVCNASFSYHLFNFPPVSKRCINSSCGTLGEI